MKKEKINSLSMSAERQTPFGGMVVITVNGNNHNFFSRDCVENVIDSLSKHYELTSCDINDIKFMW